MPTNEDIYFTTIAMSNIQFPKKLRADADIGLLSYPVATTDSTITIRTDIMQKKAES